MSKQFQREVLPGLAMITLMTWGAVMRSAEPPPLKLKSESFDCDPRWEALNNRLLPAVLPTFTQDFGYRQTSFAGKEKGEIGGRICRAPTPCYYAAKIAPKTLNDKLDASGTFAVNATSASSGVLFGWFNARQPGATGRPINCPRPRAGWRKQRCPVGRAAHRPHEQDLRHVHHTFRAREVPPYADPE